MAARPGSSVVALNGELKPAEVSALPYRMLGVSIHSLTPEDLQDRIANAVDRGERLFVVSQNLHGVYLYHRNRSMRRLHSQAHIRIDGMALVFWGRLMGYPLRREHRVTWVDWMPGLLEEASRKGWSVFFLGGEPGVAESAAKVFRDRHPRLELTTHHGFFPRKGMESERVIEIIEAAEPDLLLVGMGMPRQEEWLLENAASVSTPVVLTCGAAFEYFAGTMPTPPRWMGRVGLEWLHRLATDPVRMWKRYLVEPWTLAPLALRDVRDRLGRQPLS